LTLWVLDTNIVLDLFVFDDAKTRPLKAALTASWASGSHQWISTPDMRDELARVLAYPHIVAKMVTSQIEAAAVLAQFDQFVSLQPVAARAPAICKDPDDQKFIDLAVQHQAMLLSKDKAVLCMKKRLLGLGVVVQQALV
jgi:predicted nucleic acid-binding protein